MVLASAVLLWWKDLPKMDSITISSSWQSPSCLLPFWEALQDQQVDLTEAPCKLLLTIPGLKSV